MMGVCSRGPCPNLLLVLACRIMQPALNRAMPYALLKCRSVQVRIRRGRPNALHLGLFQSCCWFVFQLKFSHVPQAPYIQQSHEKQSKNNGMEGTFCSTPASRPSRLNWWSFVSFSCALCVKACIQVSRIVNSISCRKMPWSYKQLQPKKDHVQ